MNLKITGQDVAAAETVFDQTVEQALDLDFALPDYLPDISRVLKCRVVPHVVSKSISGSTISVEGVATITVIFSDDNGRINSVENQFPYTKSVEAVAVNGMSNITVKPKVGLVNCRPTTSRKVGVHGSVVLDIKLMGIKKTEIIADVDRPDMELLRGMAPATTPIGFSEKNVILEEELLLGQGQPSIRSVIRYDGTASVTDCKIISNKTVVKGNLKIDILYCPEDGTRPQNYSGTLPFSQIIDMEGISENCECDAKVEVSSIEIKPRTGSEGEARSFFAAVKLCVQIAAYCNNDLPVVYDAYSTKHNTDTQKNNITFQKIVGSVGENYLCKKKLEFSDGAVGTVIDLWCDCHVGATRIDGNQLVVAGTVMVCILGYDSDQAPGYFERPIDFEYRTDLETVPSSMRCDPQLEVMGSGFTLMGQDEIEVRIELSINAAVYDQITLPLIVGIELSEEPMVLNDNSALIAYFADKDEQLWDIAKRYSASKDQIMELNGISDDQMKAAGMLIIPRM